MMLDIQKFQALPAEQREVLQNSIRFVYDVFGKEHGGELAKDYMLQYGVWGGEMPTQQPLSAIPVPPISVTNQQKTVAMVEPTEQVIATVAPVKSIQEPKQDVGVYGEDWIVLQNRLLHAISNLELNERRLILFLSPLVRLGSKNKTKKNREIFTVTALDFAKKYGISPKSAYRTLELVATSVLHKAFFYWNFSENERGNKVGVSWFVTCEYKEKKGCLEIVLADEVIEMLTVFDKANPFTKYQKDMIVQLGTYGIVLFELIASCMHQQYKQKAFSIEYLREKFDCVDTYPTPTDFKRYVLDKAIQEVHKYTPYRISYTQKKEGRIVTELVFSFEYTSENALPSANNKKAIKRKKDTDERDPNTADMFTKLTDKQLARIVHSKKFIGDYNGLVSAQNPANQSSSAWVAHMVEWLKKDPDNFTKRPMQEYLDDEQAPRF